jgi:NADP-dependent 3-hydroxy acid dehydrogenase YdfG
LKADKERGETFNFNFQALEAKDIADGVLYILGAPSHVCIRELTIVPNGQPMCDD